ncbi:MAG: hypothetical protein N2115_06535 [bacterium]|nr:hypothetical protein [bacterium]
MNIEILARLLVLVCAGIAVLALLIGFIVFQVNRKKGLISFLMGVIFIGITGYYSYLFFFPLYTHTIRQEHPAPVQFSSSPQPSPIMIVIETEDGSQLTAADGDYLEIKSDVKIKVTGAKQNGRQLENIRINVIGFTPPDNPSATDDKDLFFSYRNMLKRFAMDEEKTIFKVEVKKGDEKLAEIFLKFVK